MSQQMDNLKELYNTYMTDPSFQTLINMGSTFVPGAGPLGPDIMIIGEASGQEENEQGKPFVGKVGTELNYLLKGADLDPNAVFFTNLIKFYDPVKQRNGEVFAKSVEYLKKEIEIVDPEVVGLLGLPVVSIFYPEISESSQIFKYNGRLLDNKYVPLVNPAMMIHAFHKRESVRRGFNKLKDYVGAH